MSYSLSKSESKALACGTFWKAYFRDRVPRYDPSWTRTGTEFHQYRQDYVNHLVDAGLEQEESWAHDYLLKSGFSDDATNLVEADIPNFSVNPDIVYGTELFWGVDDQLRPVYGLVYPGPGKPPAADGVLAHGSIDRVDVSGDEAVITDYKTGFMPSRIDPYEAVHYGILTFAFLPQVVTVKFVWDFVRSSTKREQLLYRSDLPQYHQQLLQRRIQRQELIARAALDAPMSCDGLAGLCGYCQLNCPVRAQAALGTQVIGPIQNDQDAREAAAFLVSIRSATTTVDSALKAYLADRGAVDIGHGKAAMLETSHSRTLPLRTVLATLGVQVPEESPSYSMPLDKLMVGSTDFNRYAKAKKRAGLAEIVQEICPTKARTVLKIGDAPSSNPVED